MSRRKQLFKQLFFLLVKVTRRKKKKKNFSLSFVILTRSKTIIFEASNKILFNQTIPCENVKEKTIIQAIVFSPCESNKEKEKKIFFFLLGICHFDKE